MGASTNADWDNGIDWERIAGRQAGLDPRTRMAVAVLVELVRRFARPRDFSACEPPLHTLSRLLWEVAGSSAWRVRATAAGTDGGEIELLVALASGTCRFDPLSRTLEPVSEYDIRPLLASPDAPSDAPINLIYVRKPAPRGLRPGRDAAVLAALRTAALFEKVWRFCAAGGLGVAAVLESL